MSHPERKTLSELDSRIAAMERRLNNAKAARASKDTIVNRLATSDYIWDEEWDRRARVPRQSTQQQRLYEDVPNGGPLLLSDVDRVRRRLKEIARNLSVMRETRLNLTTEDYFRSLVNVEAESQHDHSTMLAVRNRLNNISLTTFEPIVAPNTERIALMKYEEERDKRFAEVKAERLLQTSVEPEKTDPQATSLVSQTAMVPAVSVPDVKKEIRVGSSESQTKQPLISEPLAQGGKVISKGEERAEVVNPPLKEISPPSAPSTVGQAASAYKKTIDLFPQRNNSDTDDDIGIPGGLTSILQNQPFKPATEPTVHQSSVGILSQYLAAASTKTKDTTPSDSDDDFFK
ncbi:hypothetical protein RB195_012712 [Necator americanus]|uniref:Uncharacterized protein n=1 Tax=Necator americanus TaxID=51031 RepID=A0ABR1DSF4_NECAM